VSRRAAAAFTLVELLVVICLMVFVTGVVVAVLSGGFRVWERVQRQWEVNTQTENTFLSFNRDIHNVHPFRMIPFEGDYETFSFPLLVDATTSEGLAYKEIGRVGFFLDSTGSFCRSSHSYRGLSSASVRKPDRVIAGGIQRLRFSYLTADPVSGSYAWVDSWKDEKPPRAVKMEITYRMKTTGETVNRSNVIEIPSA